MPKNLNHIIKVIKFATKIGWGVSLVPVHVSTPENPLGYRTLDYDNNVTFTATDSHGNETSCTFVITVNDVEAPVAVCQAVTVTLDVTGAASIVASDLDGGSTDNCGVDFIRSITNSI